MPASLFLELRSWDILSSPLNSARVCQVDRQYSAPAPQSLDIDVYHWARYDENGQAVSVRANGPGVSHRRLKEL